MDYKQTCTFLEFSLRDRGSEIWKFPLRDRDQRSEIWKFPLRDQRFGNFPTEIEIIEQRFSENRVRGSGISDWIFLKVQQRSETGNYQNVILDVEIQVYVDL